MLDKELRDVARYQGAEIDGWITLPRDGGATLAATDAD